MFTGAVVCDETLDPLIVPPRPVEFDGVLEKVREDEPKVFRICDNA